MVMAPSGAGIEPATGGGGGWKEPSIGGACGGDCTVEVRLPFGLPSGLMPGIIGGGGGAGGAGGGGGGGAADMVGEAGIGGGGGGSESEAAPNEEPAWRPPFTREPSPLEEDRGKERVSVCSSMFFVCRRVSRFFNSCSLCCNIRCMTVSSSSNFWRIIASCSRSVFNVRFSDSNSAYL